MKLLSLALLVISMSCSAQPKGHYKWTVMKWTEYDGERVTQKFWQWIPPSDCTSWPEGMEWAGGIVYDKHGCAYPKINGKCSADYDGEKLPPDCSEQPPFPPPSHPKSGMIRRKVKP